MQKPLWFELNKKGFEELTRNIYNNKIIMVLKVS